MCLQLMVIGLLGEQTANVARAVEEAHSPDKEPAITQHLPAVVNSVQGHLENLTTAIHKHALVKKIIRCISIQWNLYFGTRDTSIKGTPPLRGRKLLVPLKGRCPLGRCRKVDVPVYIINNIIIIIMFLSAHLKNSMCLQYKYINKSNNFKKSLFKNFPKVKSSFKSSQRSSIWHILHWHIIVSRVHLHHLENTSL